MCGTARNPSDAETCSYCGYIFEDSLGSQSADKYSLHEENDSSAPAKVPRATAISQGEKPLRTMINVICRNSRSVKEGSLILTNRRLAFVIGKLDLPDEDISRILQQEEIFEIPLEQIATVSGNRGILRPSLNVIWRNQPGSDATTKTEFLQNYRPKNLEEARNGINEWVPIIENAAVPESEISSSDLDKVPSVDEKELRSRILDELGDMQWKGFFQISKDLREKYEISVDPDSLENACHELVKENLLEQDKYGAFFRKSQPAKK